MPTYSGTRGGEGRGSGPGRSQAVPSAPLEILLPTLDWKPDTRRPICSLPSVHSPWRPLCQRQPSRDCSLLNGQAWCPHQVHHCDGLDTCLAGRRAHKHGDPSLAEQSCLPASWSGAKEFQVPGALPGVKYPNHSLNLHLPERRRMFCPFFHLRFQPR